MHEEFNIKVPSRICLFGDHQDYLGLPVIACAIDRNMTLTARVNDEDHFFISLPDIHSERTISLLEEIKNLDKEDLFGSSIKVLRRHGLIIDKGYDITITGNIPINAGISSSSALITAWIQFLLEAFGKKDDLSKDKIAKLSYEAEVTELNSPGGNMDQITIAVGGIIFIDTHKELSYTKLDADMNVMIIGESGIPKDTTGMLGYIRSQTQSSFEMIKRIFPEFDSYKATPQEVAKYMEYLPRELTPFFRAGILNHSITQEARKEFDKKDSDIRILGNLMTEHHNILRDDLGITVDKIDAMIDATLHAGAYGAKIVGSGGGGCIVALANKQNKESIIKALIENGAKDAYEVSVSNGVTFNHET